jgi:hypothetical protein
VPKAREGAFSYYSQALPRHQFLRCYQAFFRRPLEICFQAQQNPRADVGRFALINIVAELDQ